MGLLGEEVGELGDEVGGFGVEGGELLGGEEVMEFVGEAHDRVGDELVEEQLGGEWARCTWRCCWIWGVNTSLASCW